MVKKLSIIRNGIILIVMEAIIICCYIFLSDPFDTLMDNFDDVNLTASDERIENNSVVSRTVFNMMFAALAIVPIIWFVLWCFSREPDWGFKE